MKRFFVHLFAEIATFVSAIFIGYTLIKSGHPTLGLVVMALYGAMVLLQFSVERINSEFVTIRQRKLEAALVAASVEACWVDDVTQKGNIFVYSFDVPGHGHFEINLPATDSADENTEDADIIVAASVEVIIDPDDAPEASKEG